MINNLKNIIKDRKINLSKMSKDADISRALLTKIANEDQIPNINLYSLFKISKYLHVPIFEMYYPNIQSIEMINNVTLIRNPENLNNTDIFNFYDFYYCLLKITIENEKQYVPVFISMKSGNSGAVLPDDPTNFISIEFKIANNNDINYMSGVMKKEYKALEDIPIVNAETFEMYAKPLIQISNFIINNVPDIKIALNNDYDQKASSWENSLFADNPLIFGNIVKKDSFEFIPDTYLNSGSVYEGLIRINQIKNTRRNKR